MVNRNWRKMIEISPTMSLITVSGNRLNPANQKVTATVDKEANMSNGLLPREIPKTNTKRMKEKRWEKIDQANTNQKDSSEQDWQ